jgi:hypothetical protein
MVADPDRFLPAFGGTDQILQLIRKRLRSVFPILFGAGAGLTQNAGKPNVYFSRDGKKERKPPKFRAAKVRCLF